MENRTLITCDAHVDGIIGLEKVSDSIFNPSLGIVGGPTSGTHPPRSRAVEDRVASPSFGGHCEVSFCTTSIHLQKASSPGI